MGGCARLQLDFTLTQKPPRFKGGEGKRGPRVDARSPRNGLLPEAQPRVGRRQARGRGPRCRPGPVWGGGGGGTSPVGPLRARTGRPDPAGAQLAPRSRSSSPPAWGGVC